MKILSRRKYMGVFDWYRTLTTKYILNSRRCTLLKFKIERETLAKKLPFNLSCVKTYSSIYKYLPNNNHAYFLLRGQVFYRSTTRNSTPTSNFLQLSQIIFPSNSFSKASKYYFLFSNTSSLGEQFIACLTIPRPRSLIYPTFLQRCSGSAVFYT